MRGLGACWMKLTLLTINIIVGLREYKHQYIQKSNKNHHNIIYMYQELKSIIQEK